MPVLKRAETLTLTTKVPRELHDQLDDMRKYAKEHGFEYDPADAIIKALRKDIDTSKSEIKEEIQKRKLTSDHRSE